MERYSSEPLPASPNNSQEPNLPNAGETLSLVELQARSSDQPSAAQKEALANIRKALGGWVVFDEDVKRVASELERLSPRDYKRALQQMDSEGLLQKWVDKMEPEQKRAFIDQCVRKEMVSTTAQPEPRNDDRLLRPPTVPSLYRNEPSLPDPVRGVLHEENARLARSYYQAHEQYVRDYASALQRATTPFEVRQLGEPEGIHALSEPGIRYGERSYQEFRNDWAKNVGSREDRSHLMQAVHDKLDDLAGRQRAGTLKLKGSIEVEIPSEAERHIGHTGVAAKGKYIRKYGVEGELTQYGRASEALVAGRAAEVGLARGHGEEELGVSSSVSLEANTHGETRATVGGSLVTPVGDAGVTLGSDGSTRLELYAMKNKIAAAGSYSEFNSSEGKVEGGAVLKAKLGGAELKGSVGVAAQLSRRENAIDAARMENDGIFGPLPELDARTAWKAIPPERRERLERVGWNERFWNDALARTQPRS